MSFLGAISKAYKDITGGGKKGVFNLATAGGYGLVGSMFGKGGGTPLDIWIKPLTPGGKADVKKEDEASVNTAIAAARKAAHDAEVAQLAQGALGTIALRRRRGSYATQLTGASMGSNPTSTGKTLLSQ
jgi:hypothetical protein